MGVPDAVLLVGKLAFVLTGASVGFHVVRAAWSEASVGPHALAAVAIVTGCLGLALFPVSLLPDDPGLSIALFLTGEFALHLSLVLLGVFVWQAFRRGSMLGNFLVVANAAALVATAAWECTTQDPFAFDPSMPAAHAAQLSYTFVFGWACLESARAARGAARRAALGVSAPGSPLRLGLWAVAAGALVGISLLAIVNSLDTVAQRPLLLASLTTLRGLLYLPAAAAVWLGFFPPRWWTARFAAEASNEPPGGRSNASEGA